MSYSNHVSIAFVCVTLEKTCSNIWCIKIIDNLLIFIPRFHFYYSETLCFHFNTESRSGEPMILQMPSISRCGTNSWLLWWPITKYEATLVKSLNITLRNLILTVNITSVLLMDCHFRWICQCNRDSGNSHLLDQTEQDCQWWPLQDTHQFVAGHIAWNWIQVVWIKVSVICSRRESCIYSSLQPLVSLGTLFFWLGPVKFIACYVVCSKLL